MRRSCLLVLVFLMLVSCVYYSKLHQSEVKAPTSYPVHNINTGLNYTTIQEAIDDNETSDENIILVDAGIYYEAVIVNKSISLVGTDRNAAIIDGNFTIGTLVTITANNAKISNLTIRNSHTGIQWYYNLSNIEVSSNVITNISVVGIRTGSHGRITDNMMDNNSNCIQISMASNVTIVGNTLTHSSNDALSFAYSGFNHYDSDILEPDFVWSNNFINNSRSIYNYASVTKLNSDYPTGGNYWSDYNGTDMYSGPYQNESGSDGIGDIPYVIDQYTPIDHYPLMGTFQSFNVTFKGPSPDYRIVGFEEVDIVSNSTIGSVEYVITVLAGDPYSSWEERSIILHPVSGGNGTAAFCRILVPNNLLNTSDSQIVRGQVIGNVSKLPCSNNTHTYLYFTYNNSATQYIMILPEFPSFLIPPLFIIATLLTIIFCRKKLTRTA